MTSPNHLEGWLLKPARFPQVSKGKALRDREEAVLQAVESLTRGQTEIVWIKAAILREHVATWLAAVRKT